MKAVSCLGLVVVVRVRGGFIALADLSDLGAQLLQLGIHRRLSADQFGKLRVFALKRCLQLLQLRLGRRRNGEVAAAAPAETAASRQVSRHARRCAPSRR